MSRKQVHRERRRTEKAMDEAFVALERGQPALALRLARRAREAGAMNPRILLDHAAIARAAEEWVEAEDSLRAAIAQAPNFAAAFVALADLQWEAGKRPAAARLLARALELEPGERTALLLARKFAAAGEALPGPEGAAGDETPVFSARTERFDWRGLTDDLAMRGHAVAAALLTVEEADTLRSSLPTGHETDRENTVDHAVDGRARYRWFLDLPPFVADLQLELYARCVQSWHGLAERLRSGRRLPATLPGWRRHRGRDAGHRPGARVVMLPPGGFLGPQPVVETKAFPLRVLLDLGPAGGAVPALSLTDHRPGRKVKATTADSRAGDAVVFGQRERLQQVGGVFGWQRVVWSLAPVPVERWFLDLPFDDV